MDLTDLQEAVRKRLEDAGVSRKLTTRTLRSLSAERRALEPQTRPPADGESAPERDHRAGLAQKVASLDRAIAFREDALQDALSGPEYAYLLSDFRRAWPEDPLNLELCDEAEEIRRLANITDPRLTFGVPSDGVEIGSQWDQVMCGLEDGKQAHELQSLFRPSAAAEVAL